MENCSASVGKELEMWCLNEAFVVQGHEREIWVALEAAEEQT